MAAWKLANDIQWTNIGGLDNGHKAEDQGGDQANQHSSADGEGIKQERDIDIKGLLHQVAHQEANSRGDKRANGTPDQAQ